MTNSNRTTLGLNLSAALTDAVRVTTVHGVGTLAYRKGNWLGVRLDGETRIDEYLDAHCKISTASVRVRS